MKRLKYLLSQPEFTVFLFFLGLALFSWPFIAMPNKEQGLTVFVYLFVVWGVVILILFFMSRSYNDSSSEKLKDENRK